MTTKSEVVVPGKLKRYAILALTLAMMFSGMAAAEQLYVNASTAPIQAAGLPTLAAPRHSKPFKQPPQYHSKIL